MNVEKMRHQLDRACGADSRAVRLPGPLPIVDVPRPLRPLVNWVRQLSHALVIADARRG